MEHLRKFNENTIDHFIMKDPKSPKEKEIEILEKASVVMKKYQNMSYIYTTLNENDVDYTNWSDVDVVLYYLKNFDED